MRKAEAPCGRALGRRFPIACWALGVAVTIVALACTTAPAPQAVLSRHVSVSLPQPAELGHPWHATQLLHTDYDGKKSEIPVELDVQKGWLTLVGLSGLGPPLFTIRFNGRKILTGHHAPGTLSFPPTRLVADLMLVYWPRSAWQSRLPDGWRLEDDGPYRRLFDDAGNLVVLIHSAGRPGQKHTIGLRNFVYNYQLKIVTYASDRR